ncbi:MAG TPA: MoaD/ThiS family protein [Pseudomonadales bacterium]|nr:MoaD/ThiS family protein [Pseudomonadales bacterium]
MNVLIPTQLRSYTGGRSCVAASGNTLAEVLACLDSDYPGIRFRMIDEQDRIREHIRIFVSGDTAERIDIPLTESDEVHIVGALSGG